MLLDALPAEARLARLPGDRITWTAETELLARIVEELSVMTADKRRKTPLVIPRPATLAAAAEQARPKARGLRGLTRVAAEHDRVRHD